MLLEADNINLIKLFRHFSQILIIVNCMQYLNTVLIKKSLNKYILYIHIYIFV